MNKGEHTPSPAMTFLRRRYPVRVRVAKGVIGPVPLADITLLILFFVLLHSWVLLKPGISLQLPEAGFIHGAGKDADIVTLSGEQLIFFNDERVTQEQLPIRLAEAIRRNHRSILVVEADRRLSHATLVQVYGMASAAGYREVIVATQMPSEPERPGE